MRRGLDQDVSRCFVTVLDSLDHVAISAAALELEDQSIGAKGAPTLGQAYELLRDQWRSGDRDRELGLHLMFLAWYLLFEPPLLPGLDATRVAEGELRAVFNEVHDVVMLTSATDAETLYVVGLMAHLTPWLLGPEDEWTSRSKSYRLRYRRLVPDGIEPKIFEGRGAYGRYFRHQAAVKHGY